MHASGGRAMAKGAMCQSLVSVVAVVASFIKIVATKRHCRDSLHCGDKEALSRCLFDKDGLGIR